MLATRENIEQYIPQRPPMVMIDDLLEVSHTHAITRLQIRNENVFMERGCLAEPGMVENIAQTAAVQLGYQFKVKNIPVPIGYIAAVKNLQVYRMPEQNSLITTSIRIINQVLDVTVAEGKIEQDGVLCCTCEMRIFVKTNQKFEL
jgi:3-hydroxyacyl-[acyl-carrier-protein] dehydratase